MLTHEQIEEICSLRGSIPAQKVAEKYGLYRKAVSKIWAKVRKPGDAKIQPPRKHTREDIEAIYAERGKRSSLVVALERGLTGGTVSKIWERERKRRGDPALLPSNAPGRVTKPPKEPKPPKYSPEFIAMVFALRGLRSAKSIGDEHGVTRSAIIGLWTRERSKRGESACRKIAYQRKPRPRSMVPPPIRKAAANATYRAKKRIETAARLDPAKPGTPFRLHKVQRFSLREVVAMPLNDGQGVPLLQIPPCGCHYPLGEFNEPATFFCGSPAIEGKSYCGPHFALCTAPMVVNEERVAA